MSPGDQIEIANAMRLAQEKARGYADFFGWGPNRDLEELGALTSLFESMEKDAALPYSSLRMRGRGSDPPDCEAKDLEGRRVAIEVTELVDGKAIEAFKAGKTYEVAEWDKEKFLKRLQELLVKKDEKFPNLKDPPYEGGYAVVVFTDEPLLSAKNLEAYLEGHQFKGLEHITEAVLLVSYDPSVSRCPYFRLRVDA
jgi:hypothetical protein